MRVAQKCKLGEISLKKICRKCYQKFVLLIIKISFSRSRKLSKNRLGGILDIFCDYLTAIKGVFLLLRDARNT